LFKPAHQVHDIFARFLLFETKLNSVGQELIYAKENIIEYQPKFHSINIDKTNYVIFQSKQKKITQDLSLSIDDKLIIRKQQVKFLGVLLDENLSWKPHINYVCNKISKSIGVIYRARFNLSPSTKLSLYYTLIYSYLNYCNIVWSSTYVTNLQRILILQKRIVRLLTNSGFSAHTAPLFNKLNLLDIFIR
jgi:hypothetical protein